MNRADYNKLAVVDKCVDGKIENLRTCACDIFDEIDQLYDTLKPFVENLTLETVAFYRGTDYTQFTLTGHGLKTITADTIKSSTDEKCIFNIPVIKE